MKRLIGGLRFCSDTMTVRFVKKRVRSLHWLLPICFLLTACLGTEPKNLGPDDFDTNPTRTDTNDSFAIEFALRDTLNVAATNRAVSLQGRSSNSDANFTLFCGDSGGQCSCQFFTEAAPSTAISAASLTLNSDLNVITCTVPASVADADLGNIAFVRVRNSSGTFQSGLLRVKTQLTLSETIRGLDQNQIRKVFRYDCTRQFLGGSGISSSAISCVDGMQLVFLQASYSFYLFQQLDLSIDNFAEKGTTVVYPDAGNGTGTCGLSINSVTCENSQILRYGLVATANNTFRAGIQLTSGPEPNGTNSFFGFAARTDSELNCPPGLIKVNPFQAVPGTHTREPSNFVNSDAQLNDTILEPSTETIADFQVTRIGSSGVCAAGICPQPNASDSSVEQTVSYDSLSPTFCVIPAALLEDV